jgi:hypothetical protein
MQLWDLVCVCVVLWTDRLTGEVHQASASCSACSMGTGQTMDLWEGERDIWREIYEERMRG